MSSWIDGCEEILVARANHNHNQIGDEGEINKIENADDDLCGDGRGQRPFKD